MLLGTNQKSQMIPMKAITGFCKNAILLLMFTLSRWQRQGEIAVLIRTMKSSATMNIPFLVVEVDPIGVSPAFVWTMH